MYFRGTLAGRLMRNDREYRCTRKRCQTRKTPLRLERRFEVLHVPLASQNIVAGVFSTVPGTGYSGRLIPLLRAASLAVALAGCLLFFGWPHF